jgi:hypothetical protein
MAQLLVHFQEEEEEEEEEFKTKIQVEEFSFITIEPIDYSENAFSPSPFSFVA